MTRKSGVPGKTVRALYRSQDATTRQVLRAQRDPQAQLALLDKRPGEARRERARLLPTVTVTKVDKPTEQPKRATRTRRRARRQAQKSITIKGRAKA